MNFILFLFLPFIVGLMKWFSIKDKNQRKKIFITLAIYIVLLIFAYNLAIYFQNQKISWVFFGCPPLVILIMIVDWVIFIKNHYKTKASL